MGCCDQDAGESQPDETPNRVRDELGPGGGALDEAAGVAEPTRLRGRGSHATKMAAYHRKSTPRTDKGRASRFDFVSRPGHPSTIMCNLAAWAFELKYTRSNAAPF